MFGRIFGRGKDDQDQAVCADCGRTLLAGEWTQTVIGDDGEEHLICSLCGQVHSGSTGDALSGGAVPANSGRMRETRTEAALAEPEPHVQSPAPRDTHAESDAFWQALKDKDAEIERLQAQLARAEAERQELAGRFARVGTAAAGNAGEPVSEPVAEPPSALTGDSSEPGERTWGETPAEFAAELAALRDLEPAPAVAGLEATGDADVSSPGPGAETSAPAAVAPAPPAPVGEPPYPAAVDEPMSAPATATQAEMPASVFEDTQPIPAIVEAPPAEDDASTGEITAAEAVAAVAASGAAPPVGPVTASAPGADAAAEAGAAAHAEATAGAEATAEAAAAAEAAEAASAAEAEAGAAAASLTLLQRGVDLLNVSRVPRKIAETNEQLGLPHVHVGFDGQMVAVTFLWSMGWYRFNVDIDSGDVAMSDRGYEERSDLRPNAGVRADGTVQLAPAQISRAAAQRTQAAPAAAAAPVPPDGGEVAPADQASASAPAQTAPEPPSVAAQKPPEILSKSMLGQRSDDEAASWEQTKARDFDWDR